MELRSRRKIQNAILDSKAAAAIASTNSLTPLLRLPQEIKNQIYQLVLGGNLLHISRDLIKYKRPIVSSTSTRGVINELRFLNQICCSTISEEDAKHHFDAADGSSFCLKDIELRHDVCNLCVGRASNAVRLNINLLHTCRQIYNEARFLIYSTNTFSFHTSRNLRAFIHLLVQRGVNVNRAMRSLRIDLAHINYDIHGWTQAFNAVTRHMTQLQKLYITVDQRPNWSTSASPAQKEISMSPVLDCLGILGKTAATSIVIVVSDQFLSRQCDWDLLQAPMTWVAHRWTVEEKRLWVAKVKFEMRWLKRTQS